MASVLVRDRREDADMEEKATSRQRQRRGSSSYKEQLGPPVAGRAEKWIVPSSLQGGAGPAETLSSDFGLPELGEIHFYCVKQSSLW